MIMYTNVSTCIHTCTINACLIINTMLHNGFPNQHQLYTFYSLTDLQKWYLCKKFQNNLPDICFKIFNLDEFNNVLLYLTDNDIGRSFYSYYMWSIPIGNENSKSIKLS